MGLLDILRPVRLAGNNAEFLKKYALPFFKDKNIQQEILHKGYAVRNLLNEQEISALKSSFKEIEAHPEYDITGLFWSSGRSASTAIRNLAKKSIDKYVKPALSNFFLEGKAELIGGVFVAKPPSPESSLSPHQDSSHVNEDKFMSVYAWCALTDTNLQNGAVYVLPGSHLFGNIHRSLNIPWQFEPYKELMWEYCVPLTMKAGQVLFFDSATIHCSPPNTTNTLRLGVNFFIQPTEAQFTHYFRDASTPEGQVEKFAVDIDFYYNEDFESRPAEKYPYLGMEAYRYLGLNEKKLRAMCVKALSYADTFL